MEDAVIFYYHLALCIYGTLVYFMAVWYILWPFGIFMVIWYIFSRFGMFYQEQSGNPVLKKS
jgi:hypothetical protein